MPGRESAGEAWAGLDAPWREALEAAWDSYRRGGVAVGAVLTDAAHNVGIERLPRLNEEVRRRWPAITGPLTGPLGEWLAVLPCLNTHGALLRAMEAAAPQRAALARTVARRLAAPRGLPGTADQALEQVWDLLGGHGN